MTIREGTLRVGEPAVAAPPLASARVRGGRRLLADRLARYLVTLGGVTIVLAILAILFVIVAEVYPLFRKPTARLVATVSPEIKAAPLAVGVDEYREVAPLVTPSGISFVSIKDGSPIAAPPLAALNGASVVGTSGLGRGTFGLGLSDGRLIPVTVAYEITFPEGKRHIEPALTVSDPIRMNPDGRPVARLAYVVTEKGPVAVSVIGPRDLTLVQVVEHKALIGPATAEEKHQQLSLPMEGEVTALAVDNRGDDVFVGTSAGQVLRVSLRDPDAPEVVEKISASDAGVTTLGFLLGDRTLVVGDAAGGISSWQLVRNDAGGFRLEKMHDYTPHKETVVAFSRSRRTKGFITADTSGEISLHHGTSGETLLTVTIPDGGVRAVGYAPKEDGIVALDADGRLLHWAVHNAHPEVTGLKSVFGELWYEGYPGPEYVWQSTGGTDDFEPKLSLTPLVYGTLKGTFYALIFAVPLALLGALYASQFMHPMLKSVVKPVVEIMAALPSVVLGFLAGLWLAPVIEHVVPGVLLMPLVISAVTLTAVSLWRLLPLRIRTRIKPGTEVFLLLPLVPLGAWLSLQLGGVVEATWLAGDYRSWLLSALGLTYDQRNSLVVGMAMGFAVVPIIFTIAEDSLSGVPQQLIAGSLALGATRWQTALRVVLPTASPGIFSAVMIGLGRAVGETMIVLMATGNTPVMDANIFSGFRALSANIAVELPEAPDGGTLFRVLFLAALILFVMTFVINTVAELVRLRLRKKYRVL